MKVLPAVSGLDESDVLWEVFVAFKDSRNLLQYVYLASNGDTASRSDLVGRDTVTRG